MKTYPKIETMYERGEDFGITDILKRPVLATIREWVVTEKIDGTNIRVHLTEDNIVRIGGRSDNAQLPADLVEHLVTTFTPEKMSALRIDDDRVTITLYGEGYGAGIQKGGNYRKDKGFILFDVLIGGEWWLKDDAVTEIARKLCIPRVPILGHWSLEEIRGSVRVGIQSLAAEEVMMAEGIVARPLEPLFDARGHRLIIKLKTKDWPETR